LYRVDIIGACGPVTIDVNDPVYLGSGGPCKEIYLATYTGTDQCGNVALCTQEIAVETDCSLNLGNRVFNDLNNNGIIDPTDEAMGGMRVNLWSEITGDDLPDQLVKWTTTDANGFYIFYDLEPGDYIVEIPETDLADNCIPATNDVQDPDNDMNDVNDAYNPNITGFRVMTYPVSLDFESEPMNDGDEDLENDINSNYTVDIGLIHSWKILMVMEFKMLESQVLTE